MPKERIDKLLTDAGYASSRTKAQAMVMAGVVLVDDQRVEKASEKFEPTSAIRVKGSSAEQRYVSRGGVKLEGALNAFRIDPTGKNCIDIGSSTGGFTDCLLQHGAMHVTCIDSGTNQLDWRIRTDERVDVRENTNARELDLSRFPAPFELAVMDLSFISVTKVLPAAISLLTTHADMIVLIKPQFEVGRGDVGKGGIIRDPEKHERVVREVNEFSVALGLTVESVIESPIFGAEGNKEFLAHYVL